ncbi:MAG: pitrilysin family protein [Caldilineaceae bacterium]
MSTSTNGAPPLTKATLANGMQVILQESHVSPVASFWVYYRVGSRNERPGLTGISHWVEHMLFKGTERYPQGEFDKAVARAGGSFNGMTWQDWTTYFETFPADRIELALDVESDRMVNAIFDPEETESERTVIISEREGHENSYRWLLSQEVQSAAYQAHSYQHPVIGWKEDLLTITRGSLQPLPHILHAQQRHRRGRGRFRQPVDVGSHRSALRIAAHRADGTHHAPARTRTTGRAPSPCAGPTAPATCTWPSTPPKPATTTSSR